MRSAVKEQSQLKTPRPVLNIVVDAQTHSVSFSSAGGFNCSKQVVSVGGNYEVSQRRLLSDSVGRLSYSVVLGQPGLPVVLGETRASVLASSITLLMKTVGSTGPPTCVGRPIVFTRLLVQNPDPLRVSFGVWIPDYMVL